jgi:hypothetical protein
MTALTSIGEGHRISKSGMPTSCGPQTARGAYLLAADNMVRLGSNPLFTDAVLIRYDVSMTGDLTGTLYEKLGTTGHIALPVWGKISVDPDCSFAATFSFTLQGTTRTVPMRGVFFDEGKNLFGLNVNVGAGGTQYSFGRGQRINP